MFGVDRAVRCQKAVLDVGEHPVGPAERRMARGGAIGTDDVALVNETRLRGNAAKPLAAVADDGGPRRDTGA
jgi:hypothetical protein